MFEENRKTGFRKKFYFQKKKLCAKTLGWWVFNSFSQGCLWRMGFGFFEFGDERREMEMQGGGGWERGWVLIGFLRIPRRMVCPIGLVRKPLQGACLAIGVGRNSGGRVFLDMYGLEICVVIKILFSGGPYVAGHGQDNMSLALCLKTSMLSVRWQDEV